MAGAVVLYGALAHLPAADHIAGEVPEELMWTLGGYGLVLLTFLAIRSITPAEQLEKCWQCGARRCMKGEMVDFDSAGVPDGSLTPALARGTAPTISCWRKTDARNSVARGGLECERV